jgi:hypothetical protein
MRRIAFFMALFLGTAACDSGPSGPGNLTGWIRSAGPELGGVALEVVGPGIDGFSGTGGTQVFWAPRGTADTYRVVVVGSSPGDLQFNVSVQDVGGSKPVATLIHVVDGDNLPRPATGQFRVRFFTE